MNRRATLFAFAPLLLPAIAAAHPHDMLTQERQGHVEAQIVAVRSQIQQAVTARDVVALRRLYSADFTHTHGSGKVDGRDARIVALLAGDPAVETARVEEMSIRIPNGDTAIVSGRSPILNVAENRTYDFRWVQVFARVGGEWQLIVSQATRLPPTV